MKIGMMLDTYKPYVSGVTILVSLLKRTMEQKGHEVTIFTFADHQYPDEELRVLRSPGFRITKTGYSINFSYPSTIQAELNRMDILHIHHPFISGRLGLRYRKNCPIVFTNHTRYDLYTNIYLAGDPTGLLVAMMKRSLRHFCQAVDQVIALTPSSKKILQDWGVTREIEIVPNGIETKTYSQADVDETEKQKLGLDTQDTVFVYTGRLAREKNLQLLLQSFAATARDAVGVKLLVIGDGPQRKELEQEVDRVNLTGQVVFTGLIPYEELPRYLKMGDVFITASDTETHPLTVMEAMSAGIPVIGVDSPGISDIIKNGESGFICQKTQKSISDHMACLANNPELRRRMSASAWIEAKNFDIQTTADQLLKIYARLINERAKTSFENANG